MASPTSRSLEHARKSGALAQVVERWNQHARVRVDLFGVIDLVVIDGNSILGVQACAGSSHAARRTKMLDAEHIVSTGLWLASGGRLEIWSWAKQGPRGKAKRWTLRVEAITAEMLRLAAQERAA